jgi:hypothetical protein
MFDGIVKALGSAGLMTTLGKALLTAVFIAALSEIAKRSTWLAAALVALPLATMLTVALIATDTEKGGFAVANAFVTKTFILFWPGLAFFILLLGAQRFGVPFWPSFAVAVTATFLATWGFTVLVTSLGLKID